MFRSTMIAACLMLGAGAYANNNVSDVLLKANLKFAAKIAKATVRPMIGFNVGDTCNYNMTMTVEGSAMNGTMTMSITNITAPNMTIEQDMSISGQTENCSEVVNTTSGDVSSITCNGQPQTPPAAGTVTITGESNATITVPAGTFNTVDVTTSDSSTSPATVADEWVNQDTVPVGGMVQMTTTESEMGMTIPIEAQLTSFKNGSTTVAR
jgi:hypothetical protein